FSVNAFLLFAAQSQDARVFRHLRGSAGGGADRSASLFPLQVVFGPLQHVLSFRQTVGGIVLGAGGLGNGHCVASFEQIQRDLRISLGGGQLVGGHING